MPGLEEPLTVLRGVGARRAEALAEAGIRTVGDLLCLLPRRYLDRRRQLPVAEAPVGEVVTLVVRVEEVRLLGGPRSRLLLTGSDGTARISCVWFHGGRFLQDQFHEGDLVALSGRVERYQGQPQLIHPEHEVVSTAGDPQGLHTGAVVPLYASTAGLEERGLRHRGFRALVRQALETWVPRVPEDLSVECRARLGLMGRADSLWKVHFPADLAEAEQARRRLAFDELLDLQLRLARARQERQGAGSGTALPVSTRLVPAFLRRLPFPLTDGQQRVIAEISADLARPVVMQRLLQGDVGSGKTVVAIGALLTAVEAGVQTALMAPTEILAEQHHGLMQRLLGPLGEEPVLLVGGQGAAVRRQALAAIAGGQARLVVGTHALIEPEVRFRRLGLVVVDEQHRFGVAQRTALYQKGERPHLLVMTATPIPRTLALTLYGDLDLSVLDEQPPGRLPVRTALRPIQRRPAIFAFVADQLRAGRQAYVVYPFVDESAQADLGSVLAGAEELRSSLLPGVPIGLLHGRLRSDEKAAVMREFAAGQLQVLVSTTVIEVGVDVPNATVMVVEHAERFGLAQLHQLRGRVGRGPHQGYCILVQHRHDQEADRAARERLEILCRVTDGFMLAEEDLRRRGPGEFFGLRQAGGLELRLARLPEDRGLLEAARDEAARILVEPAKDKDGDLVRPRAPG
ncbi:MAG: ATP-dependent DNA helicase RecG [Candidatus Latescibacterota bacterium]